MNKKVAILCGVLILVVAGTAYTLSRDDGDSDSDSDTMETTSSEIAPNNPASDITNASLEIKEDPSSLESEDLDTSTPSFEEVLPETSAINDDAISEFNPELEGDSSSSVVESNSNSVVYNLPKGHTGTLEVTVTTSDGAIEDVSYVHLNVSPESQSHHQTFDDASVTNELIGRTLDDFDEVFVAGASLTSAAFNNALNNLR